MVLSLLSYRINEGNIDLCYCNASYMYHGIHGTLHVECITYNNYVTDAIGSLNSKCYYAISAVAHLHIMGPKPQFRK